MRISHFLSNAKIIEIKHSKIQPENQMMAGKHKVAHQRSTGIYSSGISQNNLVPVHQETKRAKMAANKTSAANNPPFDVPSW